jgi:hypothetical protein
VQVLVLEQALEPVQVLEPEQALALAQELPLLVGVEEELLPSFSQHKLQGLTHKRQTKPLNKIVSLFIPLLFELPDTLSSYSYT